MLNIDRSSQERPSSVGSLWEKILQIKSDEIFQRACGGETKPSL